MKAITLEPKRQQSIRLDEVAEPDAGDGSVLVEAIAVGVCGTDVEIAEGKYGWAPRGKTRLVLGHESRSARTIATGGVVCLTGVGTGGRTGEHATADIASDMVLRNTSSSAASTRTSAIGTKPARRWPVRTPRGSRASSRDASGRKISRAPSNAHPTM